MLIGLGVAMFTLIILALVAILMGAKAKLVSDADVTIIVNDDDSKPAMNKCTLERSEEALQAVPP